MMQDVVVSCNLQKHVEISFGKAAVDSTNHMRRSPAHTLTLKKKNVVESLPPHNLRRLFISFVFIS
jgi:hypothetical protein